VGRIGTKLPRWFLIDREVSVVVDGTIDSKLKDAVQTHGEKDWAAITALVPSRTKHQCKSRWKDVLDPIITGRVDVGQNGQKTKTSS
jgi:hypothetical protein